MHLFRGLRVHDDRRSSVDHAVEARPSLIVGSDVCWQRHAEAAGPGWRGRQRRRECWRQRGRRHTGWQREGDLRLHDGSLLQLHEQHCQPPWRARDGVHLHQLVEGGFAFGFVLGDGVMERRDGHRGRGRGQVQERSSHGTNHAVPRRVNVFDKRPLSKTFMLRQIQSAVARANLRAASHHRGNLGNGFLHLVAAVRSHELTLETATVHCFTLYKGSHTAPLQIYCRGAFGGPCPTCSQLWP